MKEQSNLRDVDSKTSWMRILTSFDHVQIVIYGTGTVVAHIAPA
jgi:hypothetical protein